MCVGSSWHMRKGWCARDTFLRMWAAGNFPTGCLLLVTWPFARFYLFLGFFPLILEFLFSYFWNVFWLGCAHIRLSFFEKNLSSNFDLLKVGTFLMSSLRNSIRYYQWKKRVSQNSQLILVVSFLPLFCVLCDRVFDLSRSADLFCHIIT